MKRTIQVAGTLILAGVERVEKRSGLSRNMIIGLMILVLVFGSAAAWAAGRTHGQLDGIRSINENGMALIPESYDLMGTANHYLPHKKRLKASAPFLEGNFEYEIQWYISADLNRSGQLNEEELAQFIPRLTERFGQRLSSFNQTEKTGSSIVENAGYRTILAHFCALMRFYNISCYLAEYRSPSGDLWMDAAMRVENPERRGDYLLIDEGRNRAGNYYMRSTRLIFGETPVQQLELCRVVLPEQLALVK